VTYQTLSLLHEKILQNSSSANLQYDVIEIELDFSNNQDLEFLIFFFIIQIKSINGL